MDKINPTDENLEALGAELSTALGWDADNIMRVAFSALTDANFHTLREKLEKLYNEEIDHAND
jgi:hypothetical protein